MIISWKKSMIYLFVWEKYFRKKLLSTWKQSFAMKFDENNIIHISNVFDYDLWFFEQNLLSTGLFSSKNLCIIDDFPFSSEEDGNDQIKKIQAFFLEILPKINPENIIVFNQEKVDKRSKLYKEIQKSGEIKDFTIASEDDLLKKLQEVYRENASISIFKKMIQLKGINFSNIANELDKILITKEIVEEKDLVCISQDIDENIFEIINLYLGNQKKLSLLKLRELSQSLDNPYFLYNSLASNLRVYFYIFKLKKLGKSVSEIKEILDLGNRAFLIGKEYKISFEDFSKMYEKISSLDGKMKGGKLIGNQNQDMLYEIERSLVV